MKLQLPELNPGEVNAGLLMQDGLPQHWVILLPGDAEDINFADAIAWAKGQGGALPTRAEQSLLFANCRAHFQQDWYWSGEEYSAGGAWYQDFNTGDQDDCHESYELRARAIRRVAVDLEGESK